MKDIESEGTVIARVVTAQDVKQGLSFFSDDKEFLQVGSWRYGNGTHLKAHIHNIAERTIKRTQEAIIVVKGSVQAAIYAENGSYLERLQINAGEMLILFAGGHGYEITEEDTIAYEIKNGPYLGAETDRRRISG